MTSKHIRPVTDSTEVKTALSLIDDVVDSTWHLKTEWIASHKWVAVPVESASHFDLRDAECISRAVASLGYSECLGVATEPLENSILCYRVPTTLEAFIEFSRETSALNYVLISEDRFFAVLCTSEDYYIVAGPRNFVAKAVCSSLDTARKMFMRFADDRTWPPSERRRLVGVAERYAQFDDL